MTSAGTCPPRKVPQQTHCKRCGVEMDKPRPMQLYCRPCSAAADRERKNVWQNSRPRKREPYEPTFIKAAGEQLSEPVHRHELFEPPALSWAVRVRVPFSYAASKNHIYGMGKGGHLFRRQQSREYSDLLISRFRGELPHLKQNRLWISIHVEKPNHKGDAVNVVDLVCDALKKATGLDDRWYCIRNLNWSINKTDPQLIVEIGQDDVPDVIACSHCGRLLPHDAFQKNKSAVANGGRTRSCKECHSLAAKLKAKAKAAL